MGRDVPGGGDAPASDPAPLPQGKEDFAARLRELRAQAGAPSFRHLAKITHYSSSTLAEATSGRRLPTGPVLAAFVTACGGDPAPWLEELRRITASGPDARAAGSSAATPPAAERRPGWRRPAVLAAGTVLVFAAGLAVGRMAVPSASADDTVQELPGVPPFSGTPTPAPTGKVADGTDPYVGHCTADARLVDKAPVMDDRVQVGALELWYSPRCAAGWARVYLYPGEATMMGEVTVRSGDDRFATITDPLVRQVSDYTDVILPGRGGCLGAGGAVYQAGQPVVTASIPCEIPTSVTPGARQDPGATYP